MTNDETAPTRLINGRIYKSADDQRPADALVVLDGKIVWVGDNSDVPSARHTIDLQGATVLPGLTDAHIHLFAIASARLQVSLSGRNATSVGEVLSSLATRARQTAPGQWIHASGFDENNLLEHRYISRDELDSVVPDHPVLIRRFCGHMAFVNSAAMSMLKITEDMCDPEGGVFGRDANRRLDGTAAESAAEAIFRAIPRADRDVMVRSLRETIADCAKIGMTAAVEAAVGFTSGFDEELAVWKALRRTDEVLPMRLGFMYQLDPAEAGVRELVPEFDPNWQGATLKFFADGIVGARTAAVSVDYCDVPSRGFFLRAQGELNRVIVEAHRAGWQVAVHAIGDRAISETISAYEEAQRTAHREDPRHRIEHFFCPPADGFARMRELGALVVMQPSFLTRTRRSIDEAFGARAHQYYPGRSAICAGVQYIASSDAPTGSVSPWEGMASAIDRGASGGEPLGVAEALTAREAVSSYIRGAYAMRQETWRSTLEPGMAADLIVLDRDPFGESILSLRETNVLMTMVRGEICHNTLSDRLSHAGKWHWRA